MIVVRVPVASEHGEDALKENLLFGTPVSPDSSVDSSARQPGDVSDDGVDDIFGLNGPLASMVNRALSRSDVQSEDIHTILNVVRMIKIPGLYHILLFL